MVTGLQNMTYEQRLNVLGLTTFKTRMIRVDLMQVFKILNNIDRVDIAVYSGIFLKMCASFGCKKYGKIWGICRNKWHMCGICTHNARMCHIFLVHILTNWAYMQHIHIYMCPYMRNLSKYALKCGICALYASIMWHICRKMQNFAYLHICDFRNAKICGKICDMVNVVKYVIYAAIAWLLQSGILINMHIYMACKNKIACDLLLMHSGHTLNINK